MVGWRKVSFVANGSLPVHRCDLQVQGRAPIVASDRKCGFMQTHVSVRHGAPALERDGEEWGVDERGEMQMWATRQHPLSGRAMMTDRVKLMGASLALFLLTMGGLFTLFQVLFDAWMTAYPFANTGEWRIRFFIRLATIVVIGVIWSAIVVWLVRHRRGVEGATQS